MSDSFVFYRSFKSTIDLVPDAEQRAKLYQAIIEYGLDDVAPELEYPLSAIFAQMQASISAAKIKHERRVEAGRKGGQKSGKNLDNSKEKSKAKKQNASKSKQSVSKQQANVNYNVNENVNVNEHSYLHKNETPTECAPLVAAHTSAKVTWGVEIDENGKQRIVKYDHEGADTT